MCVCVCVCVYVYIYIYIYIYIILDRASPPQELYGAFRLAYGGLAPKRRAMPDLAPLEAWAANQPAGSDAGGGLGGGGEGGGGEAGGKEGGRLGLRTGGAGGVEGEGARGGKEGDGDAGGGGEGGGGKGVGGLGVGGGDGQFKGYFKPAATTAPGRGRRTDLVLRRCDAPVLGLLAGLLPHWPGELRLVVQENCVGHAGAPAAWPSSDVRDDLLGIHRVAVAQGAGVGDSGVNSGGSGVNGGPGVGGSGVNSGGSSVNGGPGVGGSGVNSGGSGVNGGAGAHAAHVQWVARSHWAAAHTTVYLDASGLHESRLSLACVATVLSTASLAGAKLTLGVVEAAAEEDAIVWAFEAGLGFAPNRKKCEKSHSIPGHSTQIPTCLPGSAGEARAEPLGTNMYASVNASAGGGFSWLAAPRDGLLAHCALPATSSASSFEPPVDPKAALERVMRRLLSAVRRVIETPPEGATTTATTAAAATTAATAAASAAPSSSAAASSAASAASATTSSSAAAASSSTASSAAAAATAAYAPASTAALSVTSSATGAIPSAAITAATALSASAASAACSEPDFMLYNRELRPNGAKPLACASWAADAEALRLQLQHSQV